jgi:muramidase (phage lysozyme)
MLFDVKDVTVDTSGKIIATLKWDQISQKLPSRVVHAVVVDSENKILYEGNKVANGGVHITKTSALLGLAEYKSAVLVKKSESSISKMNNKNCACECEARVRAFMRMLRVKEDTVGDSGYEKVVGGKSFIKDYGKDWSTHPKISVYIKRIDKYSNAAGAYQFMGDSYDHILTNYKKKYSIKGFDKESQDKMCLILLKHYYRKDRPDSFYSPNDEKSKEWRKRFKGKEGNIIQFIIDGDIKRAALVASLCWASLPDSPYGQQSSLYSFADVKKIYDDFLKEELSEKSDLHLKKGFLREFEPKCCNHDISSLSNIKWHNPIDNPSRTKYNSRGNIKPVNGAYGDVRDSYTKYHSGLDLFAIPGTVVYSCLKGTIAESRVSSTAGQIIRIKIENVKDLLDQMNTVNYSLEFTKGEIMGIDIKETDDVYLIYMHLSERYFSENDIGQIVESGTKIGLTGVSGSIASGIPNPHLHLEIATIKDAYGTGKTKRTNPARFIELNSFNAIEQDNAVNYKYNQDGTKTKWNPSKEDQTKL